MFAKFFPTAPSVLQQKKGRSKTVQEKKHLAPANRAVPPGAAPVPESKARSTRDGASGEDGLATITNGDPDYAPQGSTLQDDFDHAQGDLLNGVGSASSASTVSSVFSAANQPPPPTTYGAAHSFLTPLTTTDSSPSGKTISPPPVSMNCVKTSPEVASRRTDAVELTSTSTIPVALLDTAPPLRLHARPAGRDAKGCKVVYDPELDKKLSSKEKRSRKVQYKEFGEEVRPSMLEVTGFTQLRTGTHAVLDAFKVKNV